MKESAYQSKIIKGIEALGGRAINGNYTKAGEADLQCGWPMQAPPDEDTGYQEAPILVYLAVEVKTAVDYQRVMSCIDEVDGLYVIKEGQKGLKKHEPLQIEKINIVRRLGGNALIAYNIDQVKEYMNDCV